MTEDITKKILDIDADWSMLREKCPDGMSEIDKERFLEAFLSLAVYH